MELLDVIDYNREVGVSLTKNGKWAAFHFHGGKNNYLGQFDTEEEANKVYWDYVKRVRYG